MVPTTPDHPLKASQRQNRTGRPRLFPHIQAQIEESIEQGAFPPGTALASEHRLCEQFGVSRSLIRKVLGELTARKRIVSVPGKGYFVADPRQRVEAGAIVCLFGTPHTHRIWLDPHVAEIAEGLQEVIGHSPHRLLFEAMYPAAAQASFPAKPKLGDQRGTILVPLGDQVITPILAGLPTSLPKVIVGRPARESGQACVYVDQRQAMRQATEYLLNSGHRQIGCVSRQTPSWAQEERLLACQQTLTQAGLPNTAPVLRTAPEDHQSILTLLKREPELTALIVTAHVMLAGTLRAIEQSGRHLGRDLSLLTWDDPPLASNYAIPITAIRQPARQMGEIAADMLLKSLQTPTPAHLERVLGGELIIRQSVCSA